MDAPWLSLNDSLQSASVDDALTEKMIAHNIIASWECTVECYLRSQLAPNNTPVCSQSTYLFPHFTIPHSHSSHTMSFSSLLYPHSATPSVAVNTHTYPSFSELPFYSLLKPLTCYTKTFLIASLAMASLSHISHIAQAGFCASISLRKWRLTRLSCIIRIIMIFVAVVARLVFGFVLFTSWLTVRSIEVENGF